MYLHRLVVGVVGVPLLGGCMMLPGMGHTGDLVGLAAAVRSDSSPVPTQPQRAEASEGGLTIALSIWSPSSAAPVAIGARLRADSTLAEMADGAIWLRIQTPDGNVDQFRMERVHSSAAGTYQAQYKVPAAGLYLVTAEGRTGTAAGLRTVVVTTEVEVRGRAHDVRHGWLTPVAILGGLGTVVWMALMMGGSVF